MRGFMRQRGTAWELVVFLGRDVVTGKKRYTTRTVRAGKREAQRQLNEMLVAVERGSGLGTNATVAELLEAWFDQAQRDFSPKTVRETRGFIDRNLLPGLGHVPLPKLTTGDIDRFYRALHKGGKERRPLAPGTIRRIHGILRRALAQGATWGWIKTNPAAGASPPRVPASTIAPPTPADIARLIRSASEDDPDLAAYITLAAATGARRSEVLALRWSSVDLDRGVLTIAHGLVIGPDGVVEKDTKTHAIRRIALDAGTVEVLRQLSQRAEDAATKAGLGLKDSGFMFTRTPDGATPWFPDSVSRAFRRQCELVGIENARSVDGEARRRDRPLRVELARRGGQVLLGLGEVAPDLRGRDCSRSGLRHFVDLEARRSRAHGRRRHRAGCRTTAASGCEAAGRLLRR